MSERVGSVTVKEAADRLGVEIIAHSRLLDHKSYSTMQMWAPAGNVFRATGTHYHHAVRVTDLKIGGPGPDWGDELAVVSDLVGANEGKKK